MRLLHSQLTKLMVRTESGTELGRVHDVMYDIDSHAVSQYVVTSGILRQTTLEVAPQQVLSITMTEMIVEDTLTPIENEAEQTMPIGANPALLAESE